MKEYNMFRTSKLLDGAFGQQTGIPADQDKSTIITTSDYPRYLPDILWNQHIRVNSLL